MNLLDAKTELLKWETQSELLERSIRALQVASDVVWNRRIELQKLINSLIDEETK